MFRLLTDPRMSLDPTRAASLPATWVFALGDALELRDEAERLADEAAKENVK